jgi:ABC-type transport system involved in multi-copper enzyme maturation permease subunit
MIISGFVFAQKYHQMVADYSRNVNGDLEEMRKKAKNLNNLAFYPHRVYKSSNPLRLCAEGREKDTPNSFVVTISKINNMENRARVNFLRARIEDLDWAFIIGVIVSFAAILLTYDAICGEREDGTLRLILSNSIPRTTLLLGKYLGAAISLIMLLLIALLLNLIIVLTFDVHLTSEHWAKIGVIVLASLCYASVFLTLGLFISSITRNSTTSFVLLLFLWTIFVVIVPGSGSMLTSKIQKVPAQRDVVKQIGDAWSQVGDRYPSDTFNWGWDFKPPVPEQVRRRGKATWEIATVQDQIRNDYQNKLLRQVQFAQDMMRISPMIVYTFLCESIAGTGLHRFESFLKQVRNYRDEWREWILAEDKKDKDSFHILSNEEWTRPFSQKEVDFGNLPGFSEKEIPLVDAVRSGILDLALLILFNFVFFIGAYVAFLRYDVR